VSSEYRNLGLPSRICSTKATSASSRRPIATTRAKERSSSRTRSGGSVSRSSRHSRSTPTSCVCRATR
jgi:hypothetical protein